MSHRLRLCARHHICSDDKGGQPIRLEMGGDVVVVMAEPKIDLARQQNSLASRHGV